MFASRLKTILATAALLAALAACTQNPLFRMNMANQAYGSLNALSELLAKADLGALRSSSSFSGEVDNYAAIIGGFEVSRLLAAGHPTETASLDASLGRCVDQVRRMSDMHRTAGIAPASAVIRAVRTSCEPPQGRFRPTRPPRGS